MASPLRLTAQALRLAWGLDPGGFLRELDVSPVLGHFVLPLYEEMPEGRRLQLMERVPLLLGEWREGESLRAYTAADCAVRGAVPLALEGAGILDEGGFHYLHRLHSIQDRDTARLALLAAWDACVSLARWNGPREAQLTALEARDAATDAHWGGGHGAWALACAHHAALAVAHCARSAPEAWELGFRCLDRMLGAGGPGSEA